MPPHFDAWRDIQIERVVFHSSRSWEEAAGAAGVSISGLFPRLGYRPLRLDSCVAGLTCADSRDGGGHYPQIQKEVG